jgi:hypothetical protein
MDAGTTKADTSQPCEQISARRGGGILWLPANRVPTFRIYKSRNLALVHNPLTGGGSPVNMLVIVPDR